MIREMTDVEIEKLQQTGSATLGAHSITADEVIFYFHNFPKIDNSPKIFDFPKIVDFPKLDDISKTTFLRFEFDIMPSQRVINSTRPVQRVPCWFY